jgi:glycosyltransferase involved in cell wall biosynthesis
VDVTSDLAADERRTKSAGVDVRSLHLITSDARRGAETFAVDLVAALRALEHEAKVVALAPSQSDEAHDVAVLGRSRRSSTVLRALRTSLSDVDVVVAHGSSTLETCAVGLAGTGVPFVYRTIGDPSYWVHSEVRRRIIGLFQRRATRHVALWEGAADQLVARYSIPRSKINVIANAVPAEKYPRATASQRQAARLRLDVPQGKSCLAFVGALSAEKDVDCLIHAVNMLDDVVLLIAGDGPERGSLAALGHRGRSEIRFLGSIREPYELYAAADLLMLPSRSEGMPGVVIEAGLVGTPAVCTPVGSVPEMLTHGVTGFLTPVGNPAILAETIREALPLAGDVGARSADLFRQRYAIEKVAGQWEEVIDLAASTGRSGS